MTLITVVVFNGVTFRRYPGSRMVAHQRYFRPHIADARRGVQALHQEIWKQANGPIPEGYEVHHKDGDPLNNVLLNLELLTRAQHARVHQERGDFVCTSKQRRHLARVRPLAAAWHSSPEGMRWHKQHGIDVFRDQPKTARLCAECGTQFNATHSDAKYCSVRCQGRARRKDPDQYVEMACEICKTPFRIFKCELSRANRPRQRTCSRTCQGVMRKRLNQAAGYV